jgi:MFS family permease
MNSTKQPNVINPLYPLLIIILCAGFLFYKYVLQIYPSVITEQLMQEFNLTGAGLGNLAAAFYYAYMVTQLFVGVILDKYSTRWLTSFAILVCAIGAVLFSNSHSVINAGLSRALMGVGVAFATVAYMKLAAVWFPPRQYALVSGLLATAAMAGAVFGQAPLAWLVTKLGWRTCITDVGIAGFILTILFALIVRDAPSSFKKTKPEIHSHVSFKEILAVFKNKQNWLLTLYGGLAFCPITVFGGLWGNPFLEQAYQLTKTQAASAISLIFIGLGLGSPILGFISDRLGERRYVMFVSTLISCIAISLVLYCHPLPAWFFSFLLFIFGFFLGAFMLVFAIGKELNSVKLTATVVAMINMSDAILNGITEPGIGKLLDLSWDGKIVNGVHYFSLQSYHIALGVLPIYLLVAAFLLLLVKDKNQSTI